MPRRLVNGRTTRHDAAPCAGGAARRRAGRRSLAWLLPLVLVALVGVVGRSGGTTLALWLAQGTPTTLLAGQATMGLAVTKDGLADAATSATDTVQFTLGTSEATTLVDDGPDANDTFAVAVPFDVTLLAWAGNGLDYTIAIAAPQPDTVFGLPGPGPVLFPVNDPSACTVAAAATAQTASVPVTVTGLDGTATAPDVRTDHWCLVWSVTPPTVTNSAFAGGTNLLESPESAVADGGNPWSAYVIPDPALEPDLAVTVTPALA